jgi:5-methylcytosine-specific restriction endonuclease McrA
MSLPILSGLSDRELMEKVKCLKGEESKIIAEVVLHLHEIDSRGIYRDAGYSSLFKYCCECLGYSEGAAYRRIEAARCLKTSPEVYELLKEGKITLSALSEVSKVMKAENSEKVIDLAQGASKKEAAKIAVQFGAARAPKRETVRMKKVECAPAPDLFSAPTAKETKVEERYSFSFEVTKEVAALYEEAKALIGPCGAAEVFERALREYVGKRKAKPKVQRKPVNASPAKSNKTGVRYIPKSVRRAVFERDQERCAFRAPDGSRCTEHRCLEIDHIQPLACGGTNDIDNLRLVCHAHNQLLAERWYGRTFMERRRSAVRNGSLLRRSRI